MSTVVDREPDLDKSHEPSGARIRCPLCGWSPPARKADSLVTAGMNGTHSTPGASAQPASISGLRPMPQVWRLVAAFGVVCSLRNPTQMIAICSNCILAATTLLIILLATSGTTAAQTPSAESNMPKPGVKEVQVPFASLKPSATIKIGGTADWVLITDDAVLGGEHQPLWRTPD